MPFAWLSSESASWTNRSCSVPRIPTGPVNGACTPIVAEQARLAASELPGPPSGASSRSDDTKATGPTNELSDRTPKDL